MNEVYIKVFLLLIFPCFFTVFQFCSDIQNLIVYALLGSCIAYNILCFGNPNDRGTAELALLFGILDCFHCSSFPDFWI